MRLSAWRNITTAIANPYITEVIRKKSSVSGRDVPIGITQGVVQVQVG